MKNTILTIIVSIMIYAGTTLAVHVGIAIGQSQCAVCKEVK